MPDEEEVITKKGDEEADTEELDSEETPLDDELLLGDDFVDERDMI